MGTHISRRRENDTRRILDSIRRIVRALRVSSRAAEKHAGLSGAQLFVLEKLAEAGGPLSINEVAERTLTHQSSVSVVVQRLARRKLIAVSRSRVDARRIELVLTAAGRRALGKSPGSAQVRLIQALKRMPFAQRRTLANLLMRLVDEAGISDAEPALFFEDEHSTGKRKK